MPGGLHALIEADPDVLLLGIALVNILLLEQQAPKVCFSLGGIEIRGRKIAFESLLFLLQFSECLFGCSEILSQWTEPVTFLRFTPFFLLAPGGADAAFLLLFTSIGIERVLT